MEINSLKTISNLMLKHLTEKFNYIPLSPRTLLSVLSDYLDQHLSLCESEEFSDGFPWRETGLPKNYFLQKIVCVKDEYYLTGPRYLGGDIRRPFIDLIAGTAELNDHAASEVLNSWSALKTRSIRFIRRPWSGDDSEIDLEIWGQCINSKAWIKPDALVSLTLCDTGDFNWCEATLAEAYSKSSGLSLSELDIVPTVQQELRDYLAAGQVYRINYGVNIVGLIICCKRSTAFLPGYKIVEEAIFPKFRGQRLAAQAQSLLCQQLKAKCEFDSFLHGTIMANNIPSLRSAHIAGRVKLLEYAFLKNIRP